MMPLSRGFDPEWLTFERLEFRSTPAVDVGVDAPFVDLDDQESSLISEAPTASSNASASSSAAHAVEEDEANPNSAPVVNSTPIVPPLSHSETVDSGTDLGGGASNNTSGSDPGSSENQNSDNSGSGASGNDGAGEDVTGSDSLGGSDSSTGSGQGLSSGSGDDSGGATDGEVGGGIEGGDVESGERPRDQASDSGSQTSSGADDGSPVVADKDIADLKDEASLDGKGNAEGAVSAPDNKQIESDAAKSASQAEQEASSPSTSSTNSVKTSTALVGATLTKGEEFVREDLRRVPETVGDTDDREEAAEAEDTADAARSSAFRDDDIDSLLEESSLRDRYTARSASAHRDRPASRSRVTPGAWSTPVVDDGDENVLVFELALNDPEGFLAKKAPIGELQAPESEAPLQESLEEVKLEAGTAAASESGVGTISIADESLAWLTDLESMEWLPWAGLIGAVLAVREEQRKRLPKRTLGKRRVRRLFRNHVEKK